MKSLHSRFVYGMLPSSAIAIALLGLFANPARADVYSICPSIATTGGDGTGSFTSNGCSETMTIPGATNYAKLTWAGTTPGYPASLTLGNLSNISADVTGLSGGNPFYELAFTDPTDGLGQGNAGDQILMIEFQNSTVSGTTMGLDPNATEFNLYDNSTGTYLNGAHGQQDVNTVAGWLAIDPFLSGDSIQEIRIGIGLAGGNGPGESATVNSFAITTAVPEPTSLLLLFTILGATVWGIQRKHLRNRRG
jgi:hypothetical protein